MQPCETHTPAVLNTMIEGKDAYNTNDLLLPHPTKPGYYKVHGRVDDQIMLSTGEKVSSIPPQLQNASLTAWSCRRRIRVLSVRPLRIWLAEQHSSSISEAIISKDPLIAGAVMFGRGRAQNGIIIQPAPSLGVDVTNTSAVSAYIDSIWWVSTGLSHV